MRNIPMLGILLALTAGAGSAAASSNPPTDAQTAAVAGDYLFREPQMRAVFLGHIYEEGGELYGQFDIADEPAKLTLTDGEVLQFEATLARNNEFVLDFEKDDFDRVVSLTMSAVGRDLTMKGEKMDTNFARLRDYHADRTGDYSYRVPLDAGDGWRVGDLTEAGIDLEPLRQMMTDIAENHYYLESVLIIKNGKLVFEEYMNGWDPLRLHRLQSVTKSVTSTMTGLAIGEDLIGSVQDPVHEYLPEYSELFDETKSMIRIEHLLTMTAGFEWNEDATYYARPEDCDAHLAMAGGDFIRYVLEKPMAAEPGAVFEYNSGFPNMLGYIIETRAGMNLLEFADVHLFGPMGIQRAYWQGESGSNRPGCAGGLRLTSRDMARYGLLYLQDGMWNGEQLVDDEWVRESVQWRLDAYEGGYGYFWKRYVDGEFDAFLASGTGGQYIVCVPALDAVVVTTARFNKNDNGQVAGLLLGYVVPALMASAD